MAPSPTEISTAGGPALSECLLQCFFAADGPSPCLVSRGVCFCCKQVASFLNSFAMSGHPEMFSSYGQPLPTSLRCAVGCVARDPCTIACYAHAVHRELPNATSPRRHRLLAGFFASRTLVLFPIHCTCARGPPFAPQSAACIAPQLAPAPAHLAVCDRGPLPPLPPLYPNTPLLAHC